MCRSGAVATSASDGENRCGDQAGGARRTAGVIGRTAGAFPRNQQHTRYPNSPPGPVRALSAEAVRSLTGRV
jgi:hypothetical protein